MPKVTVYAQTSDHRTVWFTAMHALTLNVIPRIGETLCVSSDVEPSPPLYAIVDEVQYCITGATCSEVLVVVRPRDEDMDEYDKKYIRSRRAKAEKINNSAS